MLENSVNVIVAGTPTFSIIIPVYNNECFLCECIDSVLAQTYTDFELILVDDGSTDCSGKICDEYAEKDLRIKVFHTSNQGVSMARNLGLSVAQGKYINFVDSDDWVTPNCLEKYAEARIAYDYDLVYVEMVRISEDGNTSIMSLTECSAKSNKDLAGVFVSLLKCSVFGYACNKSFKRDIIVSNAVSFNKEFRLYEDAVFTAIYCLHVHSVSLMSSPVYFYRMRTILLRSELDYAVYHSATRAGCLALDKLANRLQSDSLSKAVGAFCQQWERQAVLYMYLHGKNISKKERLNYLKEFQYRLLEPLPNAAQVKGFYKFVILGMNITNDKVVDLYFRLMGFIYRLKRRGSIFQ